MLVDEQLCAGCGECTIYCPVRAISVSGGVATIDRDQCVECGVCERLPACPSRAFYMEDSLPWPRSIRAILSNPLTCFKETGVTGRGTEEMKTNDLTNRYTSGMVGFALDVGRPNVGTSLRDIEKITTAVAPAGVTFESKNPITFVMADVSTGALNPEVLDERVMSGVVEFTVPMERVQAVLRLLPQVAEQIDTVFTVGVICRVENDGTIPVIPILEAASFSPAPAAKVNVGLGRMLTQN